jgi:CBS domain-containing protein
MGSVAELMSHAIHEASTSTTVAEAATIMARGKVGSTLVMNRGRLVGIFTERDIVRALSHSPDAPADPIGHWMTANPQTISGSDSVDEALQRMVSGGFRHLPVVDDAGQVIGMLSMRDMARAGVQGATTKV